MDDERRSQVKEALTNRRAEQFALLRDLVRIDTSPDCPDKRIASERVATLLERLGLKVERHIPPPDDGTGFANLVARASLGDGPTIALVCHADTVSAGDDWSVDPFAGSIGDGRIVGLGAVSGKGHLTTYVFALLALMDAKVPLGGTVELHISFYGEQGGGRGAKWLLAENIVRPDAVVAGGPASVAARHATGSISFEVEVRGSAAPLFDLSGAADPVEAMNNALTRVFQFRTGLTSQTSKVPGIGAPALAVEEIYGGASGKGVPARVGFILRRTIVPGEDAAQVERQLTTLIGSTIAKSSGVRARIRRTSLVPAMADEGENLIADWITAELTDAGQLSDVRPGVAFENEGRHYHANGIPTVLYGAGPVDPAANGLNCRDESLELDLVRQGTHILSMAIAGYLQV